MAKVDVNEVVDAVEKVAVDAVDSGAANKVVELIHKWDVKNCAIGGLALGAGAAGAYGVGCWLFDKAPAWNAKRKLKKAEKKAAKEAAKAEVEEPANENEDGEE